VATTRKRKTASAAVAAVSEADVRKTIDSMGTLQSEVQGTIAGLGITMAKKIDELRELETAIEVRKDELKELHEIEVQADTLEQLEEQQKQFIAEDDARRKQRREEWQQEAAARQQQWAREEEAHQFEMERKSREAEATHQANVKQRQQQEAFRQADVQRALDVRIAAVAEREEAMEELQTQVDNMDATIKAEVDKQVAQATNALKRNHEHEKQLLELESQSKAQLAAQTVSALRDDVSCLNNDIADLQVRLATAQQDAKEIATSAVNASSGRQALAAVESAIETQAKASSGGRGR
jgi:hypothetical protein